METNEANTLQEAQALYSKFLENVPAVKKDAVNPHFKNRYAPLDSWIEAIQHAVNATPGVVYQENLYMYGDCQMWCASLTCGNHTLNRVVLHLWNTDSPPKPQECGSIMTYMRRYGLQVLLGRVGETDDDAQTTNTTTKKQTTAPKQSNTTTTGGYY